MPSDKTPEDLARSIYWIYHEDGKLYTICLPGVGSVHSTQSERDRDMFVAELKARLLCMRTDATDSVTSK